MRRPTILVTVTDAAGTEIHRETRGAMNAGVRASEAAVREIARTSGEMYGGGKPERVGAVPCRGGGTYTRVWTGSRSGNVVTATVETVEAVANAWTKGTA